MRRLEFQQSLAIAIGINQYGNGIPGLATPVSDARAIAHRLKTDHRYTTHLLTDHKATLSDLQHLLFDTLPKQVQANDRLVFYFAGHGIALNGEDGPEGFLIPQDARLGNTQSYLSMTVLQKTLLALPCRHFLAIFDCCFAGAFRWSSTRDISVVPEVIHQERYERFLLDPAWQVITSTAYDQTALDRFTFQDARGQVTGEGGDHSPFALALLEALSGQADAFPPATASAPAGDGVMTATELYVYLRDRVEAPTYQSGQRQTPSIFPLGKHDKGEYIFLNPEHPLNLPPAPPLDRTQNPYRGLESFDEDHAALFFGRGDRIAELQQCVSSQSLTIVIGPSGSGKSSLVKAGLVPQLRADEHWHILDPVRPGIAPLKVLKKIIADLGAEPTASGTEEENSEKLTSESLARAVHAWGMSHPDEHLLFVIDQFEELLTLGASDTVRGLFFECLEQVVEQSSELGGRFHIVLTLRADFEPQFRAAALKERWSKTRFVLPPMSRADLREAIEQPASAKVMYFQSDDPRQPLVEKIIDEVADMPGALPLLSFTLSELYLKFLERQQLAQQRGETCDRAIFESDYIAMGGVTASLTQRADQEYLDLVQQDPDYAHTMRNVMLRMVALGGGEITRRRVPLAELDYPDPENERAKQVIQRFSAARLLVKGQDLAGQSYVEPAHDALVSGWQRLLTWQREEENLGLQRRLTPAAFDWKQAQKARFLWHADPRLDILRQILNSSGNWLNRLETDFIQRSVGRKKLNGRLWTGGTLMVIALLSAGLLAALLGQRQSKVQETRFSRESARLNLSRNHSLEGLLYGLSAGDSLQHPLLRWFRPGPVLPKQVQGTLQWAMLNVKEQNRFLGHSGPVRSQWNLAGTQVVSAGEDGWLRLWDPTGKEIAAWQADSQRLWFASFSPDGNNIATAGEDGVVRLWSLAGEQLAEFPGHQSRVRYVSFSLDGRWLASAGGIGDGKIFLWEVNVGQGQQSAQVTAQSGNRFPSEPAFSWQGHPKIIKSVYFHPTKPQLVTTDPQQVKLWTLEGELVKGFDQHAWAAMVTSDGQQVVAAGDDGTVEVWEMATGKRLHQWRADAQRLWNLNLSPDGQQIATAGEDGIVKLWTLSGQPLTQFRNHVGPARSVSFSPDSVRVVSAGDDGTTRIWAAQPELIGTFLRQVGTTPRIHFVAGGQQLMSGASDGELQFWSLEGEPAEAAFPVPESANSQRTQDGKAIAIQDIDVDATGNLVARLRADGAVSIQSLEEPEKVDFLRLSAFNNTDNLALSPDGNWLAVTQQGKEILLLDRFGGAVSGQAKVLSGQSESIRRLAFSPDGRWLATAGQAGSTGLTEVWDVERQEVIQTMEEHIGQVHSVDFSPVDAQRLVSAGSDGTIRLWNVENGQSVGSPFQVYGQQVLSVAFSADGAQLVSGDNSGALQLWDMTQQEQMAVWEGHADAISDVRFSEDGARLVSAGRGGRVKIWPLGSFEKLIEQGCDRAYDFLAYGVAGDSDYGNEAYGDGVAGQASVSICQIGVSGATGGDEGSPGE